jgi:hypothetical protein
MAKPKSVWKIMADYQADITLNAPAERPHERPICPECLHPRRKDCDGRGWLEAIGPHSDGSYITSRPCPHD